MVTLRDRDCPCDFCQCDNTDDGETELLALKEMLDEMSREAQEGNRVKLSNLKD
jgi:hypothetical protein